MTGPLAVRLCWLAVLVLSALVVLVRLAPVSVSSRPPEAEPLTVPEVETVGLQAARYGDSGLLVSERNPFDPQGREWTPKPVARPQVRASNAPAAPPPGAPDGVRGVFRIPGVEGVFVADQFVGLGETVQGARVQQVDRERVLFTRDSKATATWVNREREERRQRFQQMGLPPVETR